MANFFIDRPIFAWVLAILLCLTGTLAIFSLPVEHSEFGFFTQSSCPNGTK